MSRQIPRTIARTGSHVPEIATAAVQTSGARSKRRQRRRSILRTDVVPQRPAGSSRRSAIAMLTAGLKCAPDTGPNVRISTVKIAPVGTYCKKRQRAVTARELLRP